MARKTARKSTKHLHKGKKIEKRTTLKKGAAPPVQYLQVNLKDAFIS
jgi:hypothetical protein